MYSFHFSFRLASILVLFIFYFYFPLLPTFFLDIVTALFLPLDFSPRDTALFTATPYLLYARTFRENTGGKNIFLLFTVGFRYLGQSATSLVTVPSKLPRLPCQQGTVFLKAENMPIVILMLLAIKSVVFESCV